MNGRFKVEKREIQNKYVLTGIRLAGIFLALTAGGIFLMSTGHAPITVYKAMLEGAFGSSYGVNETIVKTIPLLLAALGVSVAFRMKLWNIGAEGQIYVGGIAAAAVALKLGHLPASLLIPMMFAAGFLGGAVWGLLPAIPRALWGTNETITTLMMNYIGILWVDYLVFGPWKDPNGFNFPITPEFSSSAFLPTFGRSRVHMGILIALFLAAALYVIIHKTLWGYEIRVAGENSKAAEYAGMNVKKNILLAMAISGGIAGIAGMAELSGITHRLQSNFSPGYGYSAIIIAWLSRLNPMAAIGVSFLFGGMLVGGYAVQTSGLPAATAVMMQGLILFFVLGAEFFTQYQVYWIKKSVEEKNVVRKGVEAHG